MSEKPQLSEKASRYIEQLSKARCDARWPEVPELARKVAKHAPWKTCLATTARTETEYEQAISGGARTRGVSPTVDTILSSIKESKATTEEVFQAKTCIQWLHWIDGEYDQAILVVGADALAAVESEKTGKRLEWTDVCIVKSTFVRGASLEAKGRYPEALAVYQEAVGKILTSQSAAKESPHYKLWAERLLNRYALLVEPEARLGDGHSDDMTDALEAFRAWARTGSKEHSRSGHSNGGLALEDRLSRRKTWMSYYKLLTSLVQRLGRSSHVHVGDVAIPSRLDLCNELQRVESVYDSLLIKEVAFPQAHEYNAEVDRWTDLAMENWAILVGPTWSSDEVPQGGKRGLSKRMLDILYRAATRTFHSMTILRHLSAVHASLGEFRLAFKALDSYVTIGTKSKARTQKSGEAEPGVDTDDIFISAIAAGIETLCVFGDREEATRAQELSILLRQMLDEETSMRSPTSPKGPQEADQEKLAQHNVVVHIHSRTLSLAHRAIGISYARWSYLTYEPAKRADLQKSAISYLRKSLRGSPRNETNLEALYALALTAAESRETQSAIAAVKQALLQSTQPETEHNSTNGTKSAPSRPSTSVIRCWHLLTLLLSSRQDYDNAADSCDAALEELTARTSSPKFMASLDSAEKRSMLSIRMSRIALKELLEGPDAAVNDSMTLLALYGEMYKKHAKPKSAEHLSAPTAVPGRTLSLRGSMFGRGKADRASHVSSIPGTSKSVRRFSDSSAQQPPMLQIPNDVEEMTARPTTSRSVRSMSRSGSKRLQKRPSKRAVQHPGTAKQQVTTEGGETALNVDNVNRSTVSAAPPHLAPVQTGNNLQSEVGLAVSKDTHPGEDDFAGLQDSTDPPRSLIQCHTVHYSTTEETRRATEQLIEIWVFIAGLYRRAQSYSDAASACIEALKQVRALESAIASEKATAEEFARPGWGGAKSVEELRADVLAEQGSLKLVIEGPKAAKHEFESALTHWPDHVAATVGLANILLDAYAAVHGEAGVAENETAAADNGMLATNTTGMNSGPASLPSRPVLAAVPGVDAADPARQPPNGTLNSNHPIPPPEHTRDAPRSKATSTHALDLLAARDRAYNLLAALSKLGVGWDQSEVWFALARAYELSGQVEKAKEALWWVVELENRRPVRGWGVLGQGYSLYF